MLFLIIYFIYLFLFTDTPNTSQSEYYTSQSEYYKGDCLEVGESQGSSWPYDGEILCETSTTRKVTVSYSYIPADIRR